MNPAELLSSPAAYRLGWTIIHSLWQAAAVGLLAWMALTLLRRRSPQARYVTSAAAMAAILVLAVATFFAVQPPAPESSPAEPVATRAATVMPMPVAPPHPIVAIPPALPAVAPVVPAAPPAPVAAPPAEPWVARWQRTVEPYLPALVAVWLAGVLALSLWRTGGWVAAYRLRVVGTQPAPDALAAAARRLAERLKVSRPVRLAQSLVVRTPMVIGWLRPVILLPASAVTGLAPDQIEAILAHELAHIRRYDYLVNLVQAAVEVLFFYHPAVWYIGRRMRAERERCCDDVAVRAVGSAVRYVEALAAVEAVRQPAGTVVAATGSGASDLMARIRRLLGLPDAGRSSSAASAAAAMLVVALLATSIAVGISCRNTGEMPAATPDAPAALADVAKTYGAGLERLLPKGWTYRTEAASLVIARTEKVETRMAVLSVLSVGPDALEIPEGEAGKAYMRQRGWLRSMPYTITVSFAPPLSPEEVKRRSTEYAPVSAKMSALEVKMRPFWSKGWQPRNDADRALLAEYEKIKASLPILPDYVTPDASASVSASIDPYKEDLRIDDEAVAKECAQVRDSVEEMLGSAATVAGAWTYGLPDIRVALRPEKSQWVAGAPVRFKADIVNTGESTVLIDHQLGIEVDGWLYMWSAEFQGASGGLAPGQELRDIAVTLGEKADLYPDKGGPNKFETKAGRHILRVVVFSNAAGMGRSESRPVAFEIAGGDAKTAITATAGEPAPEVAPAGTFKAKVGDGEIELLGVRPQSDDAPWLQPDGRAIEGKPFTVHGGDIAARDMAKTKVVQLVVRTSGFAEALEGVSIRTEPQASGSFSAMVDLVNVDGDVAPGSRMWGFQVVLPSDARTATVNLGLACAPWEGVLVAKKDSGHTATATSFGEVIAGPITEVSGGTQIIVSHSIADHEIRVCAVDTDGKEHVAPADAVMMGKVGQITARFKDLPLSRVKEFVAYARAYRWVEFRDVALSAAAAEPRLPGSDVTLAEAAKEADLILAATLDKADLWDPSDLGGAHYTGHLSSWNVLMGGTSQKALSIHYRVISIPKNEEALKEKSSYIFFLTGKDTGEMECIKVLADTAENRKAVGGSPAPDAAPLPGSLLPLGDAISPPFRIIAVCEALEDTGQIAKERNGVGSAVQKFKVMRRIEGEARVGQEVKIRYDVLDWPQSHERAMKKGEQAIWFATDESDKSKPNEVQWNGLKALADTPANLKAIAERLPSPPAAPPKGKTLETLCGGADVIAVVELGWGENLGRPHLTVKGDHTLKGPMTEAFKRYFFLPGDPAMAALPRPAAGKTVKCITFLRLNADGVAVPSLEAATKNGWYFEDTPEAEQQILRSVPLPAEWSPAVDGLQMGLRLRSDKVAIGEDVVVEVCLRNAGKEPKKIAQLRYNIYDYYLGLTFTVKDDAGRQWTLAKPPTVFLESDFPLGRTLAPGEVYVHPIYLSKWLSADQAGKAQPVFDHAGRYTVLCQLDLGRGVRLDAPAVTVTVAAAGGGAIEKPVAAGLPPELTKKRDQLLAEADKNLRQGLSDLAKTYPQLATSEGRPLDEVMKERPTAPGHLSVWFHRHPLGKGVGPQPVDPANWDLMALLEPQGSPVTQIMMGDCCRNLGLQGSLGASATDPKLAAALQKLLDDALAPLLALDREAGGAAKSDANVVEAYRAAIEKSLPKGWTCRADGDSLVVARTEKVQTSVGGVLNGPGIVTPKKGPFPYTLTLAFSAPVSADQMRKLQAGSAATNEKLQALEMKMKPFSNVGLNWNPRTDAERALLAEHDKVKASLRPLPDYATASACISVKASIDPETNSLYVADAAEAKECAAVRDSVEALLGSAATMAGAWGDPVQGLRVALRPEKAEWKADETPTFVADISSEVSLWTPMYFIPKEPALWQLEIDGQWYWSGGDYIDKGAALAPGGEIEGITIHVVGSDRPPHWVTKPDGHALVLKPGRHVLRVAPRVWNDALGQKAADAQPVSRPVAFEVPEAGPPAASTLLLGSAPSSGEMIGLPTPTVVYPSTAPKMPAETLPGSELTPEEALKTPGRIVAVCDAIEDSMGMLILGGSAVNLPLHKFKVVKVLDGDAEEGQVVQIDYTVHSTRQVNERTVQKGERVLWVAVAEKGNPESKVPVWKGLKATPYVPMTPAADATKNDQLYRTLGDAYTRQILAAARNNDKESVAETTKVFNVTPLGGRLLEAMVIKRDDADGAEILLSQRYSPREIPGIKIDYPAWDRLHVLHLKDRGGEDCVVVETIPINGKFPEGLHVRLFIDTPHGALPGCGQAVADILRRPAWAAKGAVVVARAEDDARPVEGAKMGAGASMWRQTLKISEVLKGDLAKGAAIEVNYILFNLVDGEERAMAKGEEAIWMLQSDGTAVRFGVKAMADTPANRKAASAPAAARPAAVVLTPDLVKKRGDALDAADRTLRAGLVALAAKFPQLATANNKPLAEALKAQRPKPGAVGLAVGRSNKQGKTSWRAEAIADAETWSLVAILHPSDPDDGTDELVQRVETSYCRNLDLAGEWHTDAADPKLRAALQSLLNEVFAPLAALNAEAGGEK